MSKTNIPGTIGNNCEVGNAHVVEVRSSYNGSEIDAFGGASEWPTVWAEIQFQTGEERRAVNFAKKLTKLIRAEFGEQGDGRE